MEFQGEERGGLRKTDNKSNDRKSFQNTQRHESSDLKGQLKIEQYEKPP